MIVAVVRLQQFSKCRPVVEVLGAADALFSEDLGDIDAMLLRVLLELAVVSCSVAACTRTTQREISHGCAGWVRG
jgi:hypothetical protein